MPELFPFSGSITASVYVCVCGEPVHLRKYFQVLCCLISFTGIHFVFSRTDLQQDCFLHSTWKHIFQHQSNGSRDWSDNYDLDRGSFCYMINHTQYLKISGACLLLVWISTENTTYKIAKRKVNKSELVTATCKSYTFQCLDISLRYLFSFMTLGFVTNLPLIGFSQCRSFDSFSLSVLTCQPSLHQLYLLQSSPVNCHSLHTVCQ